MNKKHNPLDTIFTLKNGLQRDLEHLLGELGIENKKLMVMTIMGVMMPYMVAFTYHDNDKQYTGDPNNDSTM